MLDSSAHRQAFEQSIAQATRPLNGQLPRPWMTDLVDPLSAQVFILGRNPARSYDASLVTHERHLDALFNRNGASCRALYDELAGPASPTRHNVDLLRNLLEQAGVHSVLETNVICYASSMSADLSKPEHRGGRAAGQAIFRYLLEAIQPRVVIAHGAGTLGDLSKILGTTLPAPQSAAGTPSNIVVGSTAIVLLPSLAPPAWNQWQGWARPHLEEAAAITAAALARPEQ
ncbi:hypothetical protein AB4Z32_20860 [Massilia sp. 2TAF26]|uniref:hypothetical protein n=1 Tax=Massilia sp. 2TAF26 TaxID=3233012 RepID=UPI003F9BC316